MNQAIAFRVHLSNIVYLAPHSSTVVTTSTGKNFPLFLYLGSISGKFISFPPFPVSSFIVTVAVSTATGEGDLFSFFADPRSLSKK